MKTIEDIMGLVDLHRDLPLEAWQAKHSRAFIESALRELVERKPLSASEVGALLEDSGYLPADLESQAHFINGVRYSERAHGIGA